MIVTLLSPYVVLSNGSNSFGPLLDEVMPGVGWRDATDRVMTGGIPDTNLYVLEAEMDGPQLATLKADGRFFVLSPGPGGTGAALLTWLDGKGAAGHGVSAADDEATAIGKLQGWCRAL